MPDWKSIVRSRVASMQLEGAAELDLIDELGQHLEDRYREICSGGASDVEAYEKTVSELDDMYPLRAELHKAIQLPGDDAALGNTRAGNYVDDLWRDIRYSL